MIRKLLIKGADATIKDSKGRNVIEYMKKHVQDKVWLDKAKDLLERSIDANKSPMTRIKESLMIQHPLGAV